MGLARIFSGTCSEFGQNTSIPGWSQAARAKTRLRSLYWVVIFIAGLAATGYGLIQVVVDFYNYPVVTNNQLNHKATIQFPAITICNLNRIHCTGLFETMLSLRSRLEATNKTADPSGTVWLKKEILQTSVLFNKTKCYQQMCIQIKGQIPMVREKPGMVDNLLTFIPDLYCPVAQGAAAVVCYNLQLIKDEGWYNFTTEAAVNRTWDYYQCSLAIACAYAPRPPPGSPPSASTFKKPTSCPVTPPGKGGKGRRRKRELAPHEMQQQGSTNMYGQPTNGMDFVMETTADYKAEAEFIKQYIALDANTTRVQTGHRFAAYNSTLGSPIESMIRGCTYRGGDCAEAKYWVSTFDPNYGNCYTFNSGYNNLDPHPRKASLTGKANGFTAEIFLDQANYMLNKLSKKAGARVVLHSPYTPALPDEYGIDLAPNTASSVAITLTVIERKASPYITNCTSYWNQSGFTITTDIQYTLSGCQRFCYQKAIVDTCECYSPYLVQDRINSTLGASPCDVLPGSKDFNCSTIILRDFDSNRRTCDCNVACNETSFTSDVTVSTWPSNQYWKDLAMDMGYSSQDVVDQGPRGTEIKAEVQEDYSKVEVYYQTLNVQSIIQEAKYSDEGFFAALGGALSLYLGVAVVLVFELLELICDLFLGGWGYCNGGSPRAKKI